MTTELERVVICLDAEHCACGDVGFFVVPDHDGEPMQEKCEFCYTTPWSVFNLNAIKEAHDHRNEKPALQVDELPF